MFYKLIISLFYIVISAMVITPVVALVAAPMTIVNLVIAAMLAVILIGTAGYLLYIELELN